MTDTRTPNLRDSDAHDAFWFALGGEAWRQWLARTGRPSDYLPPIPLRLVRQ